jgi:chromatin remodeling complex protein RSC6
MDQQNLSKLRLKYSNKTIIVCNKKIIKIFDGIVDPIQVNEVTTPLHESIHLWQVNGPLTLVETKLKIRSREGEHQLEGVIVNISRNYLRSATQNEKCKDPSHHTRCQVS